MGYFIVSEENGKEHFIEAMVAGAAFVQVANAVSVRAAQQSDIERHWEIIRGQHETTDPDGHTEKETAEKD